MSTTSTTSTTSAAADQRVARRSGEPGIRSRVRARALGISGIAFAVFLLPVALIPHPGLDEATDRPVADPVAVLSFFSTHTALEQWQTVMHSLAALALLVFCVAFADRVAQAAPDRSGPLVARLTVAAGAAAAAVMLVTMAVAAGTVDRTGMVAGGIQYWLYDLAWGTHVHVLYLIPLALVPACRVLRSRRALPAGFSWTGQLVGLLSLIAMVLPAVPGAAGFASGVAYPVLFALILWLLVFGVVAVTRGLRGPARDTTAPVAPAA